ncbi:hypothetical protein QJS66_01510 [Kocuria rhizophila]|nr:hypothetical protein QJS66_01510 [Kocuria rhizophila]
MATLRRRGHREGQKVTAVKERELPEADDESPSWPPSSTRLPAQGGPESRPPSPPWWSRASRPANKVLDKLVELIEVPAPEKVIQDEISQHFDSEQAQASAEPGHDTEEHRAEVRKNAETAFRNEMILDAVARPRGRRGAVELIDA